MMAAAVSLTLLLILNYSLIDTEINSIKVLSLFLSLLSGVYLVIAKFS